MKTGPDILIVDDNPADVALVSEALAGSKHRRQITSVADGVEAMAYLNRRDKFANAIRPDLVILDLNLPKRDGLAVLAAMKAGPELRRIPVVIFSTSQLRKDVVRSFEMGANCYVNKPGNLTEFFSAVNSIEEFWFGFCKPAATGRVRRIMGRQTTNVLLIEDNPGDADLVRLRLVECKTPVNVNCVNRLSDGLASLTRETPSVVLLDLNLPDSYGADTFRRVMEHAPNVPVVVLSGHDDEVLAMKAVRGFRTT